MVPGEIFIARLTGARVHFITFQSTQQRFKNYHRFVHTGILLPEIMGNFAKLIFKENVQSLKNGQMKRLFIFFSLGGRRNVLDYYISEQQERQNVKLTITSQ